MDGWHSADVAMPYSPRNDIRLVAEVKIPQLVLEHLEPEKGLDTVGAVEAICAVGPHSAELLPAIRHTLSYLQKSLQVNCELILPGNITALLREKPELFTVLVELVLEPSQILGALRVVVEQYVGDVCVVFASLVVGLVGRGKGGLPLLAPHQRRTQEVDDGLVSVVVLQLLQVFVKGGGGELGTAGHADLVRPNLNLPSLISSISLSRISCY